MNTSTQFHQPEICQSIQPGIDAHFRLPNASMRRELFAKHLPNPDRVTSDYALLAEQSRGLSGGDILNVCVNAIYAARVHSTSAKWSVTRSKPTITVTAQRTHYTDCLCAFLETTSAIRI
jgi:hypothetical protein